MVAPLLSAKSSSFGVCTSTMASVPIIVHASRSVSRSPPTTAAMSRIPDAPCCSACAICLEYIHILSIVCMYSVCMHVFMYVTRIILL